MNAKSLFLAPLFVVALVTPVSAQSSVNGTSTITIQQVLYLAVSNTAVAFPVPTAANFNTGNVAASSAASVVSHAGNVTHSVKITAGAANMTATDVANVKPASDLEWSMDSGTNWTGVSTTAQSVRTSIAKGQHNSAATVQYRMQLDYSTDAPDTYTLPFTYTVVAG